MDWLLYENILMHNWISVLEGGYRPKADSRIISNEKARISAGPAHHERSGVNLTPLVAPLVAVSCA